MTERLENIGDAGARSRRVAGIAALAAAGVYGVLLAVVPASRVLRLSVFPLLLFGFLGVLQASSRVCVALAAKGVREDDGRVDPVADPAHVSGLRRIARRTWALALLLSGALTAGFWALPV